MHMHPFTLTFGNQRSPRLVKLVYAEDAFRAREQNECLRLENERLDVQCAHEAALDYSAQVAHEALRTAGDAVKARTQAAWLGSAA